MLIGLASMLGFFSRGPNPAGNPGPRCPPRFQGSPPAIQP